MSRGDLSGSALKSDTLKRLAGSLPVPSATSLGIRVVHCGFRLPLPCSTPRLHVRLRANPKVAVVVIVSGGVSLTCLPTDRFLRCHHPVRTPEIGSGAQRGQMSPSRSEIEADRKSVV